MAKHYVGIDLGTTNTVVSYQDQQGEKKILLFSDLSCLLPSVLFIEKHNGSRLVGQRAYNSGLSCPENRIMSSKTFIGSDKVYHIPLESGETVDLTPTDTAAEILRTVSKELKSRLTLSEEDEIWAVVTVPACFPGNKKDATLRAVEAAGLNCLGLFAEPVAAAIASTKDLGEDSIVAVVDIGGGTFDAAIVSGGTSPSIICQDGNRMLGGNDFDELLYQYLLEQVGKKMDFDLLSSDAAQLGDWYLSVTTMIRERAREIKELLSDSRQEFARFSNLSRPDGTLCQDMAILVSRDMFNELCIPLYQEIEQQLRQLLHELKMKGYPDNAVTNLVLVGGSCRIPQIIKICTDVFKKSPEIQCDAVTAVASGACTVALNWEEYGKKVGGLLAQSIGVAINHKQFSPIIGRNTRFPCSAVRVFTTTQDDQKFVKVSLFYAAPGKEQVEALDEHEYFCSFELWNIQSAPAGKPQIEVTFDFDANEHLTLTARDTFTNSQHSVRVHYIT